MKETAHATLALLDRGVLEIAAQLLIAPSPQHLGDSLLLRMQHRNGIHKMHPATVVDSHRTPRCRLI
ncbi:hypothetical protein [Rhodococcus sp. ZPP]|uniref:hypothetical protein n=1 Tax=Rhodococcus sp. ZPP TaxID=2749906 RepID=UPI001FCE2C8A|nr:hypothetical protein [Rhodococcus sp. ZPP]